ncbi:MAG: GntR family transcriptional regulator [Alphaproteobacteria bacterium]|nr:MAG: GntR family transcriptional regulator [Alphaproteobacteria bacterium]
MMMADGPILTFARSPSLAEQAAEAIVGGIAAGIFKPGERLVETNLAATLQMSRVPLREALKILEAQGIVASTPHRGTFIPTFDDNRVDQICEARIALEKIALRDAVNNRRQLPALIKRLDGIIATMEQAASRLNWLGVSKADLDFHRAICEASENAIVRTLWESLARHVLIVFGQEIRDERDAVIMAPHHRRLRDLLAAGDRDALIVEIPGHILRLRRR